MNTIIISKPDVGTSYVKELIRQSNVNKIYVISHFNEFDDLKDTQIEYLYLSSKFDKSRLETKLNNMVTECRNSDTANDNLFIINDVNMGSIRTNVGFLYTEDGRRTHYRIPDNYYDVYLEIMMNCLFYNIKVIHIAQNIKEIAPLVRKNSSDVLEL